MAGVLHFPLLVDSRNARFIIAAEEMRLSPSSKQVTAFSMKKLSTM
jgi:hypothetical protein